MCPDIIPTVALSPDRARVFISAKSADYEYAERVYRRLVESGVPTFFSRESLPELGIADYRREIDRALDEADHMIVVTSSVDHVQASWVEAEWGFFINEKRSGRKRGNIVTVVVGDLRAADLPPSLRYHEVISYDPASFGKLLRYVQEPTAAGPRSPAAAPAARRSVAFRELATLGGPPKVHLVKASPVGHVVATGGFDGAVRLYDVDTRMRLAMLGSSRYWMAGHEGLVTALEFSPDGRRLASGHINGSIHLWEIDNEDETEGAMQHDLAVSGLTFSTDGQSLATASKDGIVKLWDLATVQDGSPRHGLQRKPAPVVAMVTARDAGWLITGLINTTTRRYVIQIQETGGERAELATLSVPNGFSVLTLSDDERILAMGGQDGSVRLYDIEGVSKALAQNSNPKALPLLVDFKAHKKPITSIAFLPQGQRVVTCAMDSTVAIWDSQTGKPLTRLQGTAGELFVGAAAPREGALLVGAIGDGRLRVWEES